ncbi:MAG: penicillin acylase family protein, partial [Thermodesulfobacteriota bacterium]
THLPLSHPPIWMLMQLKTPDFHAAGVAMPGIPVIVAGYNGHVAWGMTMVMGDSQDVFLERIKKINGRDHYLYQGDWHPVKTRRETLRVKGGDPVEKTIRSTRHGPLLNSALAAEPANSSMPPEARSDFGLALRNALNEGAFSFDGMYDLLFATSMQEAGDAIRRFRLMNLNFVYGTAEHIGWQVSGRYPVRKNGRGHLPSPGWTGDYDWEGFLPPEKHPHVRDPECGYVYTANNRTIPPDQGPQLGSSWYAPERAERIDQMLGARKAYDWQDAVDMQNDRHDLLVEKMHSACWILRWLQKFSRPLTGGRIPRGRIGPGRRLRFSGTLTAT